MNSYLFSFNFTFLNYGALMIKKKTLKKHVFFRRHLISSILIKGCCEGNLWVKVILKLELAEIAQEIL